MNQEDELAVGGREQEALPSSRGTAELTSLERGDRRVERLERGDVRGPCLRNRKGRNGPVQLAPPGLHLGQFRHRAERYPGASERPVAATVTVSSRLFNGAPERDAGIELCPEASEEGPVVDERARRRKPDRPTKAAPLPEARSRAQARFDGIVHRVGVRLKQIFGAPEPTGPVSTRLDVTTKPVSSVEMQGVGVIERLHGAGKNAFSNVQDEVVVRAHQTEAHAPPFGLHRHSRQVAQELEPVVIIPKVGSCSPDAVRPDMEEAG